MAIAFSERLALRRVRVRPNSIAKMHRESTIAMWPSGFIDRMVFGDRQHKHFSVANTSGPRHVDHLAEDFVNARIIHPHGDLDFGKKSE